MKNETVVRFLEVGLSEEEKREHQEKIVSLSVDQFVQNMIMNEAKSLISKLKDEERAHTSALHHGTEIQDVECEWTMYPDFKFSKGKQKSHFLNEKWGISGNGMKVLRRLDQDLAIEEEPMDVEDFQLDLLITKKEKKEAA